MDRKRRPRQAGAAARIRGVEESSLERAGGDGAASSLSIYLRDMARTPLLKKREEVELARELGEARLALAELALKLPARCREYCLRGSLEGPRQGEKWRLDDLEEFYERLLEYAKGSTRESRLGTMVAKARRHKARLDRTREALVVANLRLVVFIAKKYVKHGIAFMDLIQEGSIGLMRAVDKFEWRRGHKFSTYAYWWIKQAVERAIADKARVIRVPVHVIEKQKKIARVSAELKRTLGRDPEPHEIARKIRMPVKKVREILGVVADPQPLESMAPDENPGRGYFIADSATPSPHERMLDHELKRSIRSSLGVLSPREQEIIRLRFGIGRPAPHTLEEIGRVVRLSRERVRQLEETALRKIRGNPRAAEALDELAGEPGAERSGARRRSRTPRGSSSALLQAT
jgi:RNA polymerase sigma factor (sigma-70 family)